MAQGRSAAASGATKQPGEQGARGRRKRKTSSGRKEEEAGGGGGGGWVGRRVWETLGGSSRRKECDRGAVGSCGGGEEVVRELHAGERKGGRGRDRGRASERERTRESILKEAPQLKVASIPKVQVVVGERVAAVVAPAATAAADDGSVT